MTEAPKRDVVFMVASGGMERMIRGLLGDLADVGGRLGCGTFDFNPDEDVFVVPNRDAGVYGTVHELLKPFERLHRRAVVMLNAAWPGSPGATAIKDELSRRLADSWDECAVIVIDPALETWLWCGLPDITETLPVPKDYRKTLAISKHWPEDVEAPNDPKGALEHLCRQNKTHIFNSDIGKAAQHISVEHCKDPAFVLLCDRLKAWFPENS
ncbi:hypothetical protein LUW76_12835 [Actinomadura madurae]|uniref:methylation-associated defense system protein MAD4 n=1 Tax=Actinomadura madurae TaxID=1993 RepID=UPI00202645C7|nr:hypothetical protein [Actinomadura madurae]URM95127.1 hypothetical protein LUW76_12835 [Actinomadura madurae]